MVSRTHCAAAGPHREDPLMTLREFAELLSHQHPALLDAEIWFVDVHAIGADCVEVRHDERGRVFVADGVSPCECARCCEPNRAPACACERCRRFANSEQFD